MQCSQCGQTIAESSATCPYCGAAQASSGTPQPPQGYGQPAAAYTQPQPAPAVSAYLAPQPGTPVHNPAVLPAQKLKTGTDTACGLFSAILGLGLAVLFGLYLVQDALELFGNFEYFSYLGGSLLVYSFAVLLSYLFVTLGGLLMFIGGLRVLISGKGQGTVRAAGGYHLAALLILLLIPFLLLGQFGGNAIISNITSIWWFYLLILAGCVLAFVLSALSRSSHRKVLASTAQPLQPTGYSYPAAAAPQAPPASSIPTPPQQ